MTHLDQSAAARAHREAEIARRLAADPAAGPARASARRQIAAEVEQEEIAAAATAANKADADAERGRVAAIVKAGRDRDRARQALRAALLAPIGPEAATGLLAAMPRDDEAGPEALAVPGFVSFGSPAAEAERRRIASAFARPEAEGRFAAVSAMILDGDGELTGAQIAPLLMTLPAEAATRRTLSIAERAEGLAEFGCDLNPIQSKDERIAEGWRRAVQQANASIGAGATTSSAPGGAVDPLAGLPGPDDPLFGTKAEYERILALRRARP